MIICEHCGCSKEVKKRGKTTARFCSRSCASSDYNSNPEIRKMTSDRFKKPVISKTCEWCRQTFTFRSCGKLNEKRRFCGGSCRAKSHMNRPERREQSKRAIKAAQQSNRGRPRPEASARMKHLNQDPEFRKKSVEATRKRWRENPTFLARGGNGKLTEPQKKLAAALDLPMEVVICTAAVKDKFECLPHSYKVDLADVDRKVAIEVDGNTHRTPRWKFLDARKTSVLEALGWVVLRFWNKEVLNESGRVVSEVQKVLASRERTSS